MSNEMSVGKLKYEIIIGNRLRKDVYYDNENTKKLVFIIKLARKFVKLL